MTGRIIFSPIDRHRCDVRFRHRDNGNGTLHINHPCFWADPDRAEAAANGDTP